MSPAAESERDLLAAEYALGLLDGAEVKAAERLLANDPTFGALVAEWHERLAPLLNEIAPVTPDAALWQRINRALDADGRPSNVRPLDRRLAWWRTYSAAISAVAAALLLVIAFDLFGSRPAADRQVAAVQPILVANVAAEDRSAAFVISYDPAYQSLLVSPAVAQPAPGHDHELWLIPASGTPRSLGLVAALTPHRLPLPTAVAGELRRNATIAISVEPTGGSRTGLPTGPVVATGKLTAV